MALIFEKVPLFKVVKAWDDNNPNLSEVYKLQSNYLQNKSCNKIHKDNGKYGTKFTIDKTIPEFNKGAEKCDLNRSDFFVEFRDVLQGHPKTGWKQVLHEHFSDPVDAMVPGLAAQDRSSVKSFHQAIQLFIQQMLNKKKPRDWQYVYMQTGGDYVFQKLMMQLPVDHLLQFEEMILMAEALPAGDMHPPNKALQLEWFYMSFHSEDRVKYVKSGQRLSNKRLKSVAEYFKNIFNLQVADGSLAKKHEHQLEQCVRHNMSHELLKRYDEKVRRVMEQSHRGDGCHSRQGNKYYRHDYKWQDCNDSGGPNNYDKRKKKQEDRTPSDRGDKAFKPCSVHGPKSKHTFGSAARTLRTTNVKSKTKNVNTRYITMTRATQVMTMSCALAPIHWSQVRTRHQPPARASKKNHKDENYHLHIDKKMKAGSHVPRKSHHQQHGAKAQLSQQGKKKEIPPTFLDDDLNFMDTVLMGLDCMDADLNRLDDITNPFDFDM
jgi:hypothetical protein